MPPRASWGGSTPQAKPKPKALSATPCGSTGGPARGGGPRYPDTGGGGPSHAPLRPPADARSGPQGSDAQSAALLAAEPGMFAAPLYSAMRRDAPSGGGQPPVGALADQGWGADAQGHGLPRGTRTPPLAADGPPQGLLAVACGSRDPTGPPDSRRRRCPGAAGALLCWWWAAPRPGRRGS